MVKILMRGEPSSRTEDVTLTAVPRVGDEIHWAERIVYVHSVKWFPQPDDHGYAACIYISEA